MREALSASIDDELGKVESAALDHHLDGCPECRAWLAAAHHITRHARITSADVVPDRTPSLLSAVMSDRRSRRMDRRSTVLRISVGVVALLQMTVMLLGILGAHHDHHSAAELAAFELALAVGLASAAIGPQRARGLLPLVGAVALGLTGTATAGVVAGHTSLVDELPHAVAVLGLVLLYALSRVSASGTHGEPAATRAPLPDDGSGDAPMDATRRARAQDTGYASPAGRTAIGF
jgi:predicted anti-sigma-YlaC factor YlaD